METQPIQILDNYRTLFHIDDQGEPVTEKAEFDKKRQSEWQAKFLAELALLKPQRRIAYLVEQCKRYGKFPLTYPYDSVPVNAILSFCKVLGKKTTNPIEAATYINQLLPPGFYLDQETDFTGIAKPIIAQTACLPIPAEAFCQT